MPRNASNIYSKPPGTTPIVNDDVDPVPFNLLMDDIATDLNTPRPIVAGGTGASSAAAALVNLGLTATAAEINSALDGITATATELNALDGVTPTGTSLVRAADEAAARTLINAQAALGFTPVQQGGGASQGTNKIYLGWESAAARLRLQVDATDQGRLALQSELLGQGQTWTRPTRVDSTSYQNTTGRSIMASIHARSSATTRTIEVSANASTWIVVGTTSNSTASEVGGVTIIIPPGWYYRINGATNAIEWAELS